MILGWSGLHTKIAQLGGYRVKVIRNQVNIGWHCSHIVKNLDDGNLGSNGNMVQEGLSELDKGVAEGHDLIIDFSSDILQ